MKEKPEFTYGGHNKFLQQANKMFFFHSENMWLRETEYLVETMH